MASKLSKMVPIRYHLVNADGQVVGRLASQIAPLLRGKHKPTFANNVDCGDHVVVINAEKVVFTGNKWKDKLYRWHTGFPGGLKERTATQVLDKDPSKILKSAVHGMLPKNKMRKVQNKKLHVFAGNEHSFKKELEGCTSIV